MDLEARRYQTALAHQVYGIVLVSEDGTVEFVNQQYCDMFDLDLSPHDLIGLTSPQFLRRVSPGYADAQEALTLIKQILDTNVEHLGEEITTRAGRTILADYTPIVVDGEPSGRMWSHRDITEMKQAERALQSNRRLLSELIEHGGNLIFAKDQEGRYELVNKRWEMVTGIERERALGRTDEELFPGPVGENWRRSDLEVMESRAELETEQTLEGPEGKRYFMSNKFPMYGDDGTVRGVCGMVTEITALKEVEEQIRHLATHDTLTDLPSLSLARDRLNMAMGMARRQSASMGLMFIDLDGFKAVNDTLGHEAGDRVLQEMARRMLSCVRETDTVARVGGDEFLIVLTGLHTKEDAARIADKLVERIAEPVALEGDLETSVSASIGVALCLQCGQDPDRLIKLADAAMYRVKNSGKNGYCFAEPADA